MATIKEPTRKISTNPLVKKVREYLTYKKRIDQLTKDQSVVKNELMSVVEEQGIEDDKGHLWLEQIGRAHV